GPAGSRDLAGCAPARGARPDLARARDVPVRLLRRIRGASVRSRAVRWPPAVDRDSAARGVGPELQGDGSFRQSRPPPGGVTGTALGTGPLSDARPVLYTAGMEFNLADLFENAVDHFGDREYLVSDGKRRTYREMEERANRLAHHLAANGIGVGDHVGIYALNSVEWVEILWAVFKLRAVWVNINYRSVEDELRYLFANADLKALVFERE